MNILFLCRTYNIGGVNVVTQFLAEHFMNDGHNVGIITLDGIGRGMENRYNKQVSKHALSGDRFSLKNILRMRQLISTVNPDVIVNNWGMRPLYVMMIRLAQMGLRKKTKIVSIYHNDPTTNGLLQKIAGLKTRSNSKARKCLFTKLGVVVRELSAFKFRIAYRQSDRFVLLSDSFVASFMSFARIREGSKIAVISNPITVKIGGFDFSFDKKGKEIIYVGRLDEDQKKVSRIVEIWNLLEDKHIDWNMTIVGDGPAREQLEKRIRELSLRRITIEGYRDPRPYYERSSILLLTSEFEGFGLVIVEGMQYGVVPIVYGSYPAVYDIIGSDSDGIILNYDDNGFNVKEASAVVENIMSNEEKRMRLSLNAQISSKRFSIETIAGKWYSLFEELKS